MDRLAVVHAGFAEIGGEIVGTMQLSFLPGLARRGALRADRSRQGRWQHAR